MKAKLDAGRALLYQTARYVDIYKALDDIARERKLTPEGVRNRSNTPNWRFFHPVGKRYEFRIRQPECL